MIKLFGRILGAMNHSISSHLLDTARVPRYFRMLPLHDIGSDNVLEQWHRAKICRAMVQSLNV